MNREINNKIIAAHKKIRDLQEKLNEAIEEKNKLIQDSYCKDIKGKFIRIIHRDDNFDELDIKEYINVEDIYRDSNDNMAYSGKGFKYESGEHYSNDIFAIYNETYQSIVTKSDVNNGNVKIVEVTKEEFEKELSNMLDFIREKGKQYRKN